jgi:TetR/AcrR family transcriptional regulator, transcriptional repressor for nem operon
MGRSREFEPDVVLEQAMHLFWQRGYANTSMKDIIEATGVRAGSLYAAFNDKENLFQKALKKYTQEFFRDSMPRNYLPLDCIRTWFAHLVKAMSSDPKQKGCLIINTALEREVHSRTTIAMIDDRLDEIEAFFRSNLAQAVRDGALPQNFAVERVAKSMLGAVVGMLVMARIRRDLATLSAIAEGAMGLLPNN